MMICSKEVSIVASKTKNSRSSPKFYTIKSTDNYIYIEKVYTDTATRR